MGKEEGNEVSVSSKRLAKKERHFEIKTNIKEISPLRQPPHLGVPTDPKRIKVIPEWPTPPSIRKIWGFHDLSNFYKRFVPYFLYL